MALKVTVTNKDFPDDHEFDIRGLGLFQNGKSRTVTEEEEAAYVAEQGQAAKDALKGIEYVKVEGTAEVKAPEKAVGEDTEPIEDKGGES